MQVLDFLRPIGSIIKISDEEVTSKINSRQNIVSARKKKVQWMFNEKMGLLVDIPKVVFIHVMGIHRADFLMIQKHHLK